MRTYIDLVRRLAENAHRRQLREGSVFEYEGWIIPSGAFVEIEEGDDHVNFVRHHFAGHQAFERAGTKNPVEFALGRGWVRYQEIHLPTQLELDVELENPSPMALQTAIQMALEAPDVFTSYYINDTVFARKSDFMAALRAKAA